MTYNELSKEIQQLSYRDKFRLAQLLIQLARKEEEEQNPQRRQKRGPSGRFDSELVQFVADRRRKLKRQGKRHSSTQSLQCFSFKAAFPMRTKRVCSLSCRSEDTSSLRRTVVFNIQGNGEAAAKLRLNRLHHRCATMLLVANVVQIRKRLNEINGGVAVGGWAIGRVGGEKSKKPQFIGLLIG